MNRPLAKSFFSPVFYGLGGVPRGRTINAILGVCCDFPFSKVHGLGGMRIGWIYAPAHVVDALNRMRGPFNVNAAAIEAGVAAMGDRSHIEKTIAHNDKWLAWLTQEFTGLGLRVTPSVGNFVLIHFPDDGKHSAEAADAFLTQRGYILRRVSAYGFPNALRMTVGTEEANRGVVAALAEFLGR